MITQALEATDGWMSPKGDFYPCYLHESEYRGYLRGHGITAMKLVDSLYEGEFIPEIDSYFTSQDFLIEQGWMRVDIESILVNRPTEYQLQSLEKMLLLPDKYDGFDREGAKKLLQA